MKRNILLSVIATLTLSGFSFAGGDILPVSEPIEEAMPVHEKSGLYLGLGLGKAYVNDDDTDEEISSNTLMLQAGYQYNAYIAFEGRYTFGFNSDYDPGKTTNLANQYDGDFSSWGIYLKPSYPIGDLSLYALLGYGGVLLDNLENGDAYESGFQWGLGASYAINDSFSLFADYVSLYNDEGFDYRAKNDDIDADTWTVGITYKF